MDITTTNFSVGDFVFLFYPRSGNIFSARILEKTIRETIAKGLNTEYIIEAYTREGEDIATKKVKVIDDSCKIFSSIEELRIELADHVMNAVNQMIDDCSSTFGIVSNRSIGESIS
mgnify:CR=1 FL=1